MSYINRETEGCSRPDSCTTAYSGRSALKYGTTMTRSLLIFLLFSIVIGASTWMTPIEFDSAFNFQVASSLLEKFSYESRYIPVKIYHEQITTNGPIQYYMALFIGLFGLDLGRALGLGILGGMAAFSIYKYSRHSFILYCLLLLFWPLFAELHNLFLGEILTITMIIVGLSQWEKWHDWLESHFSHHSFSNNSIWHNYRLWATGLAFGAAIATKLIAIGIIPLLLFCLSFHAMGNYHDKTKIEQSNLFAYWFIVPMLIALAFFMLQFSISIMHSSGNPGSIMPSLKLFIVEHLHQANTAKFKLNLQDSYLQFNGTIIILLLVSLCLLLYKNIAFSIPAIFIMVLLFIVHLNLRRTLPLIVPLLLLSIKIIAASQPGIAAHYTVRGLVVLLFSGLTLISGCLLTHTPLYLIDRLRQFSLAGAPHNVALITKDQSTYDESLITIIKDLDGPVFTTRWWQFPEISLRAGAIFYDRRAPETSRILYEKPCYLLFSAHNPPDKSSENSLCGTILYKDGDLVLCEYRPNVL